MANERRIPRRKATKRELLQQIQNLLAQLDAYNYSNNASSMIDPLSRFYDESGNEYTFDNNGVAYDVNGVPLEYGYNQLMNYIDWQNNKDYPVEQRRHDYILDNPDKFELVGYDPNTGNEVYRDVATNRLIKYNGTPYVGNEPVSSPEQTLPFQSKIQEEQTQFVDSPEQVLNEAGGYSDDEIDMLAKDVIRGKYGNGMDRKNALGDKYQAVQARVNQILKGYARGGRTERPRVDMFSGVGLSAPKYNHASQ